MASPPSPFALMRRLAEEMDRLFGDFRFGTSSLLPRFELPWEGREGGAGHGRSTPDGVGSSTGGAQAR